MPNVPIELTGKVFGRWTVIREVGRKRGQLTWLCRCMCGKEKVVAGFDLRSGASSSCGCLHDELARKRMFKHGLNDTQTWKMFLSAKQRATKRGLPFNIELTDIIIPETCPLLGLRLQPHRKNVQNTSPSLDRIIPDLGYVKGNIRVISHRANTLKNDASLDELEMLVTNLRRLDRAA